ncbi:MAG: type VI secretion system baseplate subunit TssE [Phyllobacteriaceae bacterium]|nr:type VI secretion system baseplate subunit TssE [Phyllobacteriaceae bacterium]
MASKSADDRFQIPIMHCFREAFAHGDARKYNAAPNSAESERFLSQRAAARRKGLSDTEIRSAVRDDLVNLVSTIDLQSAVDLDGFEHVARSVINYGLYDIGHLTSEDAEISGLEDNITAALASFEPRIKAQSLHVERNVAFNAVEQKVSFSISAEISNRPLDVPIDFVAEIDMSVGKVKIAKIAS